MVTVQSRFIGINRMSKVPLSTKKEWRKLLSIFQGSETLTYLRDHSSITSSWFWPFLTHPPYQTSLSPIPTLNMTSSFPHTHPPIYIYFFLFFSWFWVSLRDHSSITSSKRWVGGVRKWQFLMIYSTVNHQRSGWVGPKMSKTWWCNTWMVP